LEEIKNIINFLTGPIPTFGGMRLKEEFGVYEDYSNVTIGCLTGTLGELKAIVAYAETFQ